MTCRNRIAPAVLALAVVLACGKDEDPVIRAIADIEKAAEARDAGEVLDHVAADFQGADGSARADVEGMLRRYLAAYADLDVDISGLEIERGAGAARAQFVADLSGKARSIGGLEGLLPQKSRYRFDVRFAPGDDGRWRIAWAAWEYAGR